MVTKIGVDLGYANITLSNAIADIYREPSVILVDKNTRRILAIGAKAALYEDSSESTEQGILVRPFKNGLLYSAELTKEIVGEIISSVQTNDKIRCLISLPSDMLAKQESEIFDMLEAAGCSECYSVKRPVAALVGAGYAPTISVISVNIGASSTEIAVLHKGDVIISERAQVGGEDFDRAIKEHILEQGEMNVSLLVARTIKERLGAVWQGRESESIDIEGTLSLTGGKVKMSISTEDVVGVFEKPLQKFLMAVASVIKRIPIDCVNDIFDNGIVLTGGGAELFGIETMLEKVIGISVTKPANAIDCVAKGLSRIHTFIPLKNKMSNKNITDHLSKFYETKKNQK
ncbi:MAG: rod shape-determining protein [Clostridia bacterium]|nr:rod shape-determining protein [Clostridia bacterium]